MVDRPGCGLTEPIKAPFHDIARLEASADGFITDVLDSLELDRANVVATSFGGYIGFHSAAAHPERIKRMVEFGYSIGDGWGHAPWMDDPDLSARSVSTFLSAS